MFAGRNTEQDLNYHGRQSRRFQRRETHNARTPSNASPTLNISQAPFTPTLPSDTIINPQPANTNTLTNTISNTISNTPRKRKRTSKFLSSTTTVAAVNDSTDTMSLPNASQTSGLSRMGHSYSCQVERHAKSICPRWIRVIAKASNSPCVAFVLDVRRSAAGTSQARFTPLRSFLPLDDPDCPAEYEFDADWVVKKGKSPKGSVTRSALSIVPSQVKKLQLSTKSNTVLPASTLISAVTADELRPTSSFDSQDEPASSSFLDTQKIPVEIFEHITNFLSRDEVKNLRLVDKAFERGVSAHMFGTVVVPFNTEIYGMLAHHQDVDSRLRNSRREATGLADPLPLHSSERDVRKTLDIFRGFGPHIRRYGMSFEVKEHELSLLADKTDQHDHNAYWGNYPWPFPEYRRFTDRANLESTADETSTMKLAFSNLTGVQHLALSLDCGLGWLNGTDRSLRATVLQRKAKIFGASNYLTEADVLAQRYLWSTLENMYEKKGVLEELKFAEIVRLEHDDSVEILNSVRHQSFQLLPDNFLNSISCIKGRRLESLLYLHEQKDRVGKGKENKFRGNARDERLEDGLGAALFEESNGDDNGENDLHDTDDEVRAQLAGDRANLIRRQMTPSLARQPDEEGTEDEEAAGPSDRTLELETSMTASPFSGHELKSAPHGLLLVRRFDTESAFNTASLRPFTRLSPKQLTKSQKEWLLESKWAQDAFLSSYMLAITDNRTTFSTVQTLTLSRFSSTHVSKLSRPDFWAALPLLTSLHLEIIADWRNLEKDNTGCADDISLDPSSATRGLYDLLQYTLAPRESLKILSFGWADGGEHAEGIQARNNLILPAPILPTRSVLATRRSFHSMLEFPYVEHLKLVNCWLTPNALRFFTSIHREKRLTRLTLESVSITTHPQFNRLNPNHNLLNNVNPFVLPGVQHNPVPNNPVLGQALSQLQQLQAQGQAPQHQQVQAAQQMVQQQLQQIQQLQQNMHQILRQQHQQQHPQPSQTINGIRLGSWGDVTNQIKKDFLHAGNTALELVFLSCGYALLCSNTTFDQSVLEVLATESQGLRLDVKMFLERRLRSKGAEGQLLYARDNMLATVVTALPPGEMDDLQTTWGLREGWPRAEELEDTYDDEDGWGKWGWRSQQAAEHDGARHGGSGRFSGRIQGFSLAEEDDLDETHVPPDMER